MSPPDDTITNSYPAQRLGSVFNTGAARLGTEHETTQLALVAFTAEALGYSPITIKCHATDSGAFTSGHRCPE